MFCSSDITTVLNTVHFWKWHALFLCLHLYTVITLVSLLAPHQRPFWNAAQKMVEPAELLALHCHMFIASVTEKAISLALSMELLTYE